MSTALLEGKVSEYVGFDQDKNSLAHVQERLGDNNVRTVRGSIADLLLARRNDFGNFDLVYAAGLYDFLSQKLATRLTTWMFNATRPGGITLLTNYLPDPIGAGFMEAFMEWNLVFRTPEELVGTTARIPSEQIAERTVYLEKDKKIVFVELRKATDRQRLITKPYHPALRGQERLPRSRHAEQALT